MTVPRGKLVASSPGQKAQKNQITAVRAAMLGAQVPEAEPARALANVQFAGSLL